MSKKRSNGEGSITVTVRNGKPYYTSRIMIGEKPDGTPIRKSFSSFTKREVQKWLRAIQVDKDNGMLVNLEDKTVSELYHIWLFTYKKPKVTPSTFSSYESKYRLYTKEKPIGSIKIKNLKSIHIQTHLNNLKEAGKSDNLIKNIFNQFESFIEFLRDENIIKTNPTNTINLPQTKKLIEEIESNEEYNVFSIEEQRNVVMHLKNSSNTIDLLILFTFATGLRRSEVIALTWNDIINGQVRVGKQYLEQTYITDDGKKTYINELTYPKTEAGIRYVEIPDSILKILEKHKVEQMKHRMKLGQYYNNNNLIFCDELGNYYEKKRPNRRIQSICMKLGIPKRTFHQIRHSYATRLFELGVSVKTVQVLLGHESIEPTMKIYTHVSKEIKQEAVAKLDEIL